MTIIWLCRFVVGNVTHRLEVGRRKRSVGKRNRVGEEERLVIDACCRIMFAILLSVGEDSPL